VNKVVLIVEDEKEMQELMKIYIKKAGLRLQIYSAYNGKEGVEIYKKLMKENKKPSLVIMDLKLPGMNGVEASKRILKLDPNANIYGFTAFFDTQLAKNLLKAGAKKIIPRHVGFKGFVNELKNFFGE